MNTEKKIWLLAIVFGVLFIYAVYNIFAPDRFPMSFVRGQAREITPLVLVGPYPTEREIKQLKARGVQVLVSFLNPANPAETMLEEEERRNAAKAGFEYLNFPMDFLHLGDLANSEQIRLAVERLKDYTGKKIYVHCYLGRHRVAMFEKEFLKKAVPETQGPAAQTRVSAPGALAPIKN
ncbi:MAG: hypothetical protein HY887_00740 [Deltaproteobacteria bacterium]|nr:hypothetical protein [Deltaproteobacteria bacterium]